MCARGMLLEGRGLVLEGGSDICHVVLWERRELELVGGAWICAGGALGGKRTCASGGVRYVLGGCFGRGKS